MWGKKSNFQFVVEKDVGWPSKANHNQFSILFLWKGTMEFHMGSANANISFSWKLNLINVCPAGIYKDIMYVVQIN